jgi:hypothetical protein
MDKNSDACDELHALSVMESKFQRSREGNKEQTSAIVHVSWSMF